MCLVWGQLTEIRTSPVVTTDFLYIRFIGDRTIQEKVFGKIQKESLREKLGILLIIKSCQRVYTEQ